MSHEREQFVVPTGEAQRVEAVFEADNQERLKGAGRSQFLVALNDGHGGGGGSEADIPQNERGNDTRIGRCGGRVKRLGGVGAGEVRAFPKAAREARRLQKQCPCPFQGRTRMHRLACLEIPNRHEPFRCGVHLVGSHREHTLLARGRVEGRIVEIVLVQEFPFFAVIFEKPIGKNALANLPHQPLVKISIMLAQQLPAEWFGRFRKVMQIRSRKARAGRARAGGVQRFLRKTVNAAAQLQHAARRKHASALGDLRGHDAVEHVHSAVDRLQNVQRGADAHQVTRLVVRHQPGREIAHCFPLVLGLADSQAADGKSVKGQFAQALGAFPAQFLEQSALHDGKERLGGIVAGIQTAKRPAMCDAHRGARGRFVGGRRHALVEHHHDVAADRPLHFDAQLRA